MTTETTESPRSLGRYELVHLLGQGGMGEVYLAKISGAAGFEKPCIVKTILPTLLKDRQFLDRFHHEAKVLVHLVHSSIAQVYDMGEANGTYYMALEYVAGVDVAYLAEQARNQDQSIPVPVALYLGQKVAEGLGYAHRKAGPDGTPLGIVHRDVSPHNVMVSYEGEVKVIDFGLAKSAARSKYTLPATVMGKLGYMSPEQARAEPLDHRSDIYSCGVMVWELLAGRPLIAHGTVGEMMAAMANPTVPALHELRPDVEPAVDAVIRRALAPHPQERYARSDEFARALNEQLLRASSSLGAEEVGNFVKGLCPEAFSAQRKLISRISGVRRSPSTPPNTGVLPASGVSPLPPGAEPMTGLEATSVRPLSEMQAAGPGATLRPMVTPLPGASMSGGAPAAPASTSAMAAPPVAAPAPGVSRSRAVGLVLGLFVLMVGTAATTVYFMRGEGNGPPAVAHGPGSPPPPPPPPHGEPPPFPRDHREPPPGMSPPPPAAQEMPAHPSAPATAVVGASGSADTASAAPAVGAVGSVAVAPAVAEAPEAPGEPSAEDTPKAQTERPKPRESKPEGKFVVAKDPVQIRQRGRVYIVPAGLVAGLRSGTELQVVGAEGRDGKRRVLGNAVVESALPRRSVLRLDTAATKARGDRFVVLPEALEGSKPVATDPEPAPAPAPEPVVAAPAEEKPRELQGGAKASNDIIAEMRKIILHNAEDSAWTRCRLILPGKRVLDTGMIRKGRNEFAVRSFAQDSTEETMITRGKMLVRCSEGQREFSVNL